MSVSSLIIRYVDQLEVGVPASYLWSEVECGQDMLMLCPWCPPWVIELETLITEIGSAVSTAFGGLQSLRRFTELAHHCHTAQAHCVSVPGDGIKKGSFSL